MRIEQLYPFPTTQVQSILNANKTERTNYLVSRKEPENMGGFSFVKPIFNDILNRQIEYVGTNVLQSPAVGFMTLHAAELESFLKKLCVSMNGILVNIMLNGRSFMNLKRILLSIHYRNNLISIHHIGSTALPE